MAESTSLISQAKVWKFGNDISTDLIMPGMFRSQMLSVDEMTKYLMHSNRPGWAGHVEAGDIIVAGRNFGCGSSRPAPRMLKRLGISMVVAESMSRLFFRNSVNVGFPVLICAGVFDAFDEGDTAEVDAETGEVTNITQGTTIQGDVLSPDSPPYQILKAGGLDPFLKEEVARMKASQGTS